MADPLLLLLVSSHSEDQSFASAVAAEAGLSFESVSDPKRAAQRLAEVSVGTTVLVDCSTEALFQQFETALQETVGLFSDKVNSNRIHMLSSEPLDKCPYLVKSPVFGHFLERNFGADPAGAGTMYGRVVKMTLKDRAFGLQNYLKAGTKIQVVKLTKSQQKQEAVEAVRNFLLTAKFQNRMATLVSNAVDELLMNAMYDAPVDEMGKQMFSQMARSTPLDLKGQHEVEMHIGFDGTQVGITAVDHFGSLDKNKLLGFLSKIYKDEEYKVKMAVAGAGIGLATVYQSGASLLFVSETRTRTEVSVFFRKTASTKEFKEQFRFLATQLYF